MAGEVRKEDFNALAGGRDPESGEILVMPKPGGEHRAGIDLTFSAPKSVSILSLADHQILKIHEAAVTAVLNYVESHYAQARTTKKGVTQAVDTGNLVVAKFNHMTSREMDPQLHTHGFVMNITQRPDQAWRAVSNEQIYRQQRFLGQVYRSELASEIRKLGYEISITNRSQGFFEVRGIPRALSQEFSKRREQVLAQVKALKQSGEYPNAREAQLYEIAALGSRREKEEISAKELMNRWTETISAKGLTLEAIREHALREATKARELKQEKDLIHGSDAVRKGAEAVTEQESVFHREKVLETGLKLTVGEKTIRDLEDAYKQLLKENTLKHLGEDRRGALFTTKEMQVGRESDCKDSPGAAGKPGIDREEKRRGVSLSNRERGNPPHRGAKRGDSDGCHQFGCGHTHTRGCGGRKDHRHEGGQSPDGTRRLAGPGSGLYRKGRV